MKRSCQMGSLLLATLVLTGVALGKPIEYHVSMTFSSLGTEPTYSKLLGARLHTVFRFDAEKLMGWSANRSYTPIANWITDWDGRKSTVSAAISGAGEYDGPKYAEIQPFSGNNWSLRDNVASKGGKDEIRFPIIFIHFDGDVLQITSLRATVDDLFQGNRLTVMHPKAFTSDMVSWVDPPAYAASSLPASPELGDITTIFGVMTDVSGFAVFIPEPSAFAVAATSLIGLSAIRRRQSSAR